MRATRFLLPAEIEMVEAAVYYETQVGGCLLGEGEDCRS